MGDEDVVRSCRWVVGRPGSGKSFLADLLQQSLPGRGGAVHEFRITSRALRTAGQRIDVAVLATSEALSRLGVLDRYVQQIHATRAGRYVSWENHDAGVSGLPTTLQVIEDERLADRITVFRRDMEVLYRNELIAGTWKWPTAAAQVVASEQVRPRSAQQTWWFRQELSRIAEQLVDVRVSAVQRLAVRSSPKRVFTLSGPARRIAQPLLPPSGVDNHRLSAGEHREIFRKSIVPALGDITAHDAPLVVYVMGQPGAGKSRLARLVRQALRDRRPTAIAGDDFKTAHPDYVRLLEASPRMAGTRIRADYRAWQEMAEAYVRARRGDAVVEVAPGSAGRFLGDAARYHEAGYRVELVVMGVRAADSRQGTAVRYAESIGKNLPARFTTASGHYASFTALADTVWAAEHARLLDSLVVVRRSGRAVYRNQRAIGGAWTHPVGAVRILAGEQQRPYSEEEAERFLAVQRRLHAVLPQYRAEIAQITRLAWPLLPTHRQPPRLADPGMPTALPVRYGEVPGCTTKDAQPDEG
ncbi:zeta toxin family protein [Streptomyces sp. NPDC090075]|uniref:zeta toxin family protein n=1 Tax=Streptomyces sp. NPDC090075 TaxID=3365937 RepID=UPI00382F9EFD